MHKLAKGLKKKKKSKKGKKGAEEDEFDPEELERYRRERAEAQEKAAAEAGASENSGVEGGSGAGAAGSDEWQKFQALTAGVDSILKKTQGDLDRIKSTSFFQRKAPEEDQKHKKQKEAEAEEEEARNKAKRWVGFDKEGNPIERSSQDSGDEGSDEARKRALRVTEEGFVDVPEDEDEQDDSLEEDIFDTTYVDVLQNIDVQLAYIPDSPTEEELGDDPFDTTNADKVLRTVDKTGKKLVSLGNAVEVLSGRVDHVSTCKISRPRKAPRTQDLLLEDFEDSEALAEPGTGAPSTGEPLDVERTLLDDDSDLPDVPIDLTNLPPVLPRPVSPNAHLDTNLGNDHHRKPPLDVSEFEILKEKTILEEIPDLDDAEFELAPDLDVPVGLEESDDPFGEKETPEPPAFGAEIDVHFEVATFANEEDPFDTTFADNILPGKTELKFIEKELEELPPSEVSISLTDPAGLKRDYETGLLSSDPSSAANTDKSSPAHKQDLLGGSCTDLTQLTEQPIAPEEEITYVDPFDTSAIRDLPPGQAELKFLERELLGEDDKPSSVHPQVDEDDDFDPRREETPSKPPPPTRPQHPFQPATNASFAVNSVKPSFQVNFDEEEERSVEEPAVPRGRKPSRPEILGLGPSKSVAFELPTPSKRPDLLQTSEEEKSISSKPLTPYYSQKSLEDTLPQDANGENPELDPFDTSFVANVAPGKTELKLIESELLAKQESKLKHSISDHEFDPRFAEEKQSRGRRQSDFGATSVRPTSLKGIQPEASLIEEFDATRKQPSAFEVNAAAHRRTEDREPKRQESLLDAEVEVDAKPLTPRIESRLSEDEIDISYADPFDTSIATNILPGKAELKLLENELSQLPQEVRQVKVNPIDLEKVSARPGLRVEDDDEDDFDPRAGELKLSEDFLCLDGHDSGHKVLTPINDRDLLLEEDLDPFDTSFASLGPGKTELKLLESELMNE